MTYKAEERLCLNFDRSAIVDCDSPEAHWQLAMPGQAVSDEDCKKYGLGKPAKTEPEAKPEEKAKEEAPENKAVTRAPANKGRK